MGLLTLLAIGASIISGGASYVQAKKAAKLAKRAAKQGQGLLINSDGTNNFIPVIYGTRRIAGTRVFVATGDDPTGDFNGILYLVYVLCEGEVDAITDILIDDLPTSDARFAYTNSVRINIFKGTDVQTADNDFIAAGIGWTSDHTLKGLAYITVRLKWNSDAFSSIPNITALVRGKKVYDTRTATTAYSTNPALCIRDYLTNTRYGKGLSAASIDDAEISAAATFYDTTVTFWTSGAVGKLFEFNAVIDTEQKILENLKDMLFCCRGFLPYTNGVYQLIPDKSAASTFAFTTNNIVSGISIRGESKEDKYNKVILTFTDPDNSWQENTAIWPDAGSTEETTYLAQDGGVELVGDFELPCITNYYAARDLARVFLLRSRNALRCAFDANSDALNLSVGDVVTVTHPTPGFSAKPFQVEELTINYDGTCRVSLLEYDSSIYSYDPASEQLSYPDTDLPDPYSVVAPTDFVVLETTYLSNDGTLVPEIEITWTASADAFVDYYEFEFKKSSDTVWQSAIAYQPIYVNTFAVVGTTYDMRVRAVNSLGVTSSFLTSTYTVAGDTTAPAIPTGVTITGDYNLVTATWSAATEKDYKESWVYQNTTGTTPNLDPAISPPFRKVTGNTVTASGLAPSTTYYVWVRNVDFSDNRSGFSSAGTFTTTAGSAAASVVAGGTIAGSVTTDGVQISTVRTNAALAPTALQASAFDSTLDSSLAAGVGYIISGEGGDYRLNVGASSVVAKHKDASELGVSPYAGTLRTGLIVTANGIGMGYNRKDTGAWVTAVAIDSTGNIAIRGDISATTGTFAGTYSGTVTAGQITTGTLSAAVTTTNNLILSTAGKIYTSGKTSAASTTAGVFLGHDGGSSYDFAVGDATRSIVYDGSAGTFTITGEVVVLGSLVANTSKEYDSGNFKFEFGTATVIAGYAGAGIFRTQKNTSFGFGAISTASDSFALAGQSTNSAGAGYGGAFVNSTSAGGTSHRTEAYLTNSTQAGLFRHTSTTNQAILGNSTYAIDTDGDVYVDGDITATGTITPFTGSHDGVMFNTVVPQVGDILIDSEIIATSGISEALARMVISSTANQSAIGVYSGDRIVSYLPLCISDAGDPIHVAGNTYTPGPRVLKPEYENLLDESRIIGVNSVGEGLINVCGENGNIAAGDLIVTSNTAGKGMKQADDIIRSRTVAKARESVTFDTPEQVKQIACIYLCG